MQTAAQSADLTRSLVHIRETPLGRLPREVVESVVQRIVPKSGESTQIEVAAFNSSI